MSKNTKNTTQQETAENLSPITLAEIAAIRARETMGYLSNEVAERHIRVIIGQATGNGVPISKNIDKNQLFSVIEGMATTRTLLSIAADIIFQRSFDPANGRPLQSTTLDTSDAHHILKLLDIADSMLEETEYPLTVLTAE